VCHFCQQDPPTSPLTWSKLEAWRIENTIYEAKAGIASRQTDEDGNVPPVKSVAEGEAKHKASVERQKKLAEQLRAMMSDTVLEENHDCIKDLLSKLPIS
jgi:hypothetical protein